MARVFINGLRTAWALALSGLSGAVLWVAYLVTHNLWDALPDVSFTQRVIDVVTGMGSNALFIVWLWMYFYGLVAIVFAMPLQALLQAIRLPGYLPSVLLACLLGAFFWHQAVDGLSTFDMDVEDLEFYRAAHPERVHWDWLGIGALLGAYFGSVAWLIRRPDKDIERLKKVPAAFLVTDLGRG